MNIWTTCELGYKAMVPDTKHIQETLTTEDSVLSTDVIASSSFNLVISYTHTNPSYKVYNKCIIIQYSILQYSTLHNPYQ